MKNNCTWKKNTIWKAKSGRRYEYVCGDKFTIDVTENSKDSQGYPASNQVNVFRKEYGGWILNTPKNFSNTKDVKKFVNHAKRKLQKGEFGRQVAFSR